MKLLLDIAIDALPFALNVLYGGIVIHILGSLGLALFEIEHDAPKEEEKPLRRIALIHQAILLGLVTLTMVLFAWYRPENFPSGPCILIVLATFFVLWPYAAIDKHLGLYKPKA